VKFYDVKLCGFPLIQTETEAKLIWQWAASRRTGGGSDPKISPSSGGTGARSNTMLYLEVGTTRESLPNGISFGPTDLAECMSVTDDGQTNKPRYGNMCRNRRNRLSATTPKNATR